MGEDMARVQVNIDEDLNEVLGEVLEHGERTEIIRETLRLVAEMKGFGRTTPHDAAIASKQAELADLREAADEHEQKAREIRRRISEVEDEIDTLRGKRDDLASQESEYKGALQAVERQLRQGVRITEDDGRLRSVAESCNKTPRRVFEDLRERNPDVPGYAFEDGLASDYEWNGMREDHIDLPVENREPFDE